MHRGTNSKQVSAFLDVVMEMSSKELKDAETEIDILYRIGDADVEFTRHFMNRVLDQGDSGRFEYDDNQAARDTDVTPDELVKMFSKFWKEKGKIMALQLKRDPKSFEFVLKDVTSSLNIPIAVSYDQGRKVVRLDCKTLMRKSQFSTGNQKVVTVRT